MFTAAAVAMLVVTGLVAVHYSSNQDREPDTHETTEEATAWNIKGVRNVLWLIALLLAEVILMLGIIADRIR